MRLLTARAGAVAVAGGAPNAVGCSRPRTSSAIHAGPRPEPPVLRAHQPPRRSFGAIPSDPVVTRAAASCQVLLTSAGGASRRWGTSVTKLADRPEFGAQSDLGGQFVASLGIAATRRQSPESPHVRDSRGDCAVGGVSAIMTTPAAVGGWLGFLGHRRWRRGETSVVGLSPVSRGCRGGGRFAIGSGIILATAAIDDGAAVALRCRVVSTIRSPRVRSSGRSRFARWGRGNDHRFGVVRGWGTRAFRGERVVRSASLVGGRLMHWCSLGVWFTVYVFVADRTLGVADLQPLLLPGRLAGSTTSCPSSAARWTVTRRQLMSEKSRRQRGAQLVVPGSEVGSVNSAVDPGSRTRAGRLGRRTL